ncbi:tRNA modification GTPase MnmE [Bacilli bacterium]|nr:tRNA modification GTPase MnmE [Bacilli bacterium]
MKTIVALSTPPANGAIHIIRVSGQETYKIINKISDKLITKKGYSIQLTNICDKNKIIDNVLVMKFVAPNSFTGEDLIEINCHGNLFLANKIIQLLIQNGCELAKHGEFSQRSFLNNKITINNAASINNLINSKSDIAIEIANNGLNKNDQKKLNDIKEKLFMLVGQIEVNIDYPEYDDTPIISKKECINTINIINKEVIKIINNSINVQKIFDGFKIAIVGKPNVGKSSLYNSLINEDKAIVSSIPGTTRDINETNINIGGVGFIILDTAGIHKTNNEIEKIGIDKANKCLQKSDIILFVYDSSNQLNNDDNKIIKLINAYKKNKQVIYVANKSDLKSKNILADSVAVSAKNNDIKKLVIKLQSIIKNVSCDVNKSFIIQNNLGIELFKKIQYKLNEIISTIKHNSIEFSLEPLKECIKNINIFLGIEKDYDFINEMFSKFCIGK